MRICASCNPSLGRQRETGYAPPEQRYAAGGIDRHPQCRGRLMALLLILVTTDAAPGPES